MGVIAFIERLSESFDQRTGLLFFRHQLNMSAAMLADDFAAHVLRSRTKFAAAMWAGSIEGHDFDCSVVAERFVAVLALNLHALVLGVDAQLFLASRAQDIMTFRFGCGDHSNLRKRIELRDLYAVFC